MSPLEAIPKGLFITGTDTDVGKTVITCGLIQFFNQLGIESFGVKPVCCGGTDDLDMISAANPSHLPKKILNPLYLEKPAAPQSIQTVIPPLKEVLRQLYKTPGSLTIVEGAGGWKVPVSKEWDMEALAISLDHPVIIVVANKLGALNHTLLTVQAIQAAQLHIVGFFLNTVEETAYSHAQSTNKAVLEELLPYPCLGEIPVGGASIDSLPLLESLKISSEIDLPLHFFPKIS